MTSSSLLPGRSPCGLPGDGRASPFSGEPPTGAPCAGDPDAPFGGGRDRVLNRSFLPVSSLDHPRRISVREVVLLLSLGARPHYPLDQAVLWRIRAHILRRPASTALCGSRSAS